MSIEFCEYYLVACLDNVATFFAKYFAGTLVENNKEVLPFLKE